MPEIHLFLLSSHLVDTGSVNFVFTLFQFLKLGAVLATIAYLVGDLETLTAENKITELDILQVNDLFVKNSIVVGEDGRKSVVIL